jgi:hypothetical protein
MADCTEVWVDRTPFRNTLTVNPPLPEPGLSYALAGDMIGYRGPHATAGQTTKAA